MFDKKTRRLGVWLEQHGLEDLAIAWFHEGKTSQQALICISRRLSSVSYGMLKNGMEYRMSVVENTGDNR